MNKIVQMIFGSALYGTSTPNSDLDMKAVYVPTGREIVLGNYKSTISKSRPKADCERNTKDDTDMEIFSLDRYLELLTEGQTVALDILFAPPHMYMELNHELAPVWQKIFDNRDKLLTRNVSAFIGYARMQAAKYGIKGSRMDALKSTVALLTSFQEHLKLMDYIPEIEAFVEQSRELISLEKTPLVEIVHIKAPNDTLEPHLHVCGRKIPYHATAKYAKQIFGKILEGYGGRAQKAHLAGGVDWKALSHAVRVNGEALELLSTLNITFPRPDRELLTQIKLGQLPYEQVAEKIEQGLADLYIAHEKSTLRDAPDKEWADNLIYEVYSDIVKNS